ncbi:hypothetical protein [Micromonospora sp. RV43]|uniref:hypothetical protein n=1 Tax=Micromonospora sp. RV43 TaxID=1661387 RepID=UPI00064C09AF|nr:hypothetical protein [Micromonospora sp. RV43]
MIPNRPPSREEALIQLARTWTAADHDRRTRALINAGPITLTKLDATAARVASNLPARGMPLPNHVIRERDDPRVPEWARQVAERMAGFRAAQLAETFTWTTVDEIHHVTVDLASEHRTVRLVARINDVQQSTNLADVASQGRILHAHLSWQPHPILIATVALPPTAQPEPSH